jgi:hypothetical protein
VSTSTASRAATIKTVFLRVVVSIFGTFPVNCKVNVRLLTLKNRFLSSYTHQSL